MLTRCTSCRGQKKVMKLGSMMGECKPCKGIGYVEKQDVVVKQDSPKSAVVRKRGKNDSNL